MGHEGSLELLHLLAQVVSQQAPDQPVLSHVQVAAHRGQLASGAPVGGTVTQVPLQIALHMKPQLDLLLQQVARLRRQTSASPQLTHYREADISITTVNTLQGGRSSVNRRGISVDLTGIIDAGYEGQLIIPIRNNTTHMLLTRNY